MSGDMPKVWWSPSEAEWYEEFRGWIGDGSWFSGLTDGRQARSLPDDAVELKPVSGAPAAPVEIVINAFKRSGVYVDPESVFGELDEIAEKASGSLNQLARNGFQGDVPLASLTDLLTVTTALREVLGMAPSRTAKEVHELGPWLPEGATDDV